MGIPFLAVYNVYSAALRGIGDSKAPFYAVLLSSVTNVVLDILLVAVLRWHVAGAAIATVISQAAMTLFLILYGIRRYPLLRFSPGRKMLSAAALRQGLHFGLPPMIQSSISSLGSLILQNFMNGFGTQTVAAITTAYRIDTIVLLPIINLGSGISTLTAQSYGAGRTDRTRRILLAGSGVMLLVSLALTLLVIPTGGHLIALFGAGAEAVRIGSDFFLRIASFYVVLRTCHVCPGMPGRDRGCDLFQHRRDRLSGLPYFPFLCAGRPFWKYGDRLCRGFLLASASRPLYTAGLDPWIFGTKECFLRKSYFFVNILCLLLSLFGKATRINY